MTKISAQLAAMAQAQEQRQDTSVCYKDQDYFVLPYDEAAAHQDRLELRIVRTYHGTIL